MSDNARYFVDTNIFVYSRDLSEPQKQEKASLWLDCLWSARALYISMQVINEYYAVVTRKLTPGLSRHDAREDVTDLMSLNPLALDGALCQTAWSIEDRYEVSWWDALIIAAAQHLNCNVLLSEDLHEGQNYGGIIVVNPFTQEPPK